MKVNRFFYVSSPRCETVHRMYSKTWVEGNQTACGRLVTPAWQWSKAPAKRQRTCEGCLKASISA